jgi:hypothetical protein
MGIYIKIDRLLEKKHIAYYKVFTKDFGGANFYISIDKAKRLIYCYLTEDFSNPIRTIQLDNQNELIGNLPGVSAGILGRVIMKVFRILELEKFPDILDYSA